MSRPTVYSSRAARQLDTVAVEVAKADAARERAEADAAAQSARLRAERERQSARAEMRALAEAESRRRRERRRNARVAAWAARSRSIAGQGELLATVCVIALFVVVALPAQVSFLAERWPWPMALAGGVALESLTWVFALQGRARSARGQSAGVHHLGIWCAAGAAACINLLHGAQMWGGGSAIVAASGSMAAPLTWHMYLHSQSSETADPELTRRERRRRRHHRRVGRVADRLRTALPAELTSDQAWSLAWRAVHGAEPGITAKLLSRHAKAAAEVSKQLRPGDRADLGALDRPLTVARPPQHTDVRAVVDAGFAAARPVAELLADSVYLAPRLRAPTGRTGSYSLIAARAPVHAEPSRPDRTASVQTAVPADVEIEAKRRSARAEIRRILASGATPSPTEIGRAYGLSPEWGAKQIRTVRNEQRRSPAAQPAA